ncbi:MAG TPA: S41 family peptidase, partial [Thiotrichaceae bacterium]|nr:S41 family peptidase [Thiotrichaceae bacterium]
SYLDSIEYQDIQKSTIGEFGGIGIEIEIHPEYILIVRIIESSPAARTEMKKGDKIYLVNGESVANKTKVEARTMLSGPIGENIELTIEQANNKNRIIINVKREIIKTDSHEYQFIGPHFGLVKISSFHEDTVKSVTAAIEQLIKKSSHRKLKGLVLDLRNNPGGLLDAAIGIVDLFISKGTIVSTDTRDKAQRDSFKAHNFDILKGAPLVVLVNGASASGSEIVAGALQDHKRAVIVGERTFGKGSVQNIIMLEDQVTALKLTTSRYFTPLGRSIQARGITPDIKILASSKSKLVDEKKNISRELELQGHIENNTSKENLSDEYQALNAIITKSANTDIQLYTALSLLKGLSVLDDKRSK